MDFSRFVLLKGVENAAIFAGPLKGALLTFFCENHRGVALGMEKAVHMVGVVIFLKDAAVACFLV